MFAPFGKVEAGALSWSKAVQGGVWADEVVEEEEQGNKVVGRSEGRKALFGFVPSLELLVKALDEVVGNVIVEALNADVLYPMQRLNRHLVSGVSFTHNGLGSPHRLHGIEYGESLRTVPVAIQMETEDKAGFTVQNKPEVVFLALNFNHSFIGVPLVRVEIKCGNELYSDVLEQWSKPGTPIADGRVRYLNIHHSTQNQGDIAERVLAQVEHGKSHEDHMDRIAHPLEIRLSKEFGHRWSGDGRRLWYKQRVVALLVTAAIVTVMLPVVMQESGFSADWTGRVILRSNIAAFRGVRCPLVSALLAQVLLVPMCIFPVAIKVSLVVALWTADLI